MSDTGSTPGSGSAPFKTYQMSLRRAKREAAEAREATDALKTLERTVPLWWQMVILARRDVTHQSLQAWQEKTSELVDSAQADFLSGVKSRFYEGAEKSNQAHSLFQSARKDLNKDIQSEIENLESISRKLENDIESKNSAENYISDKKDEIKNEKWSRYIGLVFTILVSFVISMVLMIPVFIIFGIISAISGASLDGVLGFIFIIVWIITTFVRYSGKDKDIDKLKDEIDKNKNKIEKLKDRIEKNKNKKKETSKRKCSMEEDGRSIEIDDNTSKILEGYLNNDIEN